MEKDKIGKELTKEDIEKTLNELEGIYVDISGNTIDGEYKDYGFEINEENNVYVSEKLKGGQLDCGVEITDLTNGLDVVPITVWGTLEGGTVTIESLDGLKEKEDSTKNSKNYEVTENGTYTFKITGSNGRKMKKTCTVKNAVIIKDDILTAIASTKESVKTKVKVKGITKEGKSETITYTLDIIYYSGDLTFSNTLKSGNKEVSIPGLSFANKIWTVGNVDDVDSATVVLKVDGNIVIEDDITVTSVFKDKSGPLGMIIYCPNKIELNRDYFYE